MVTNQDSLLRISSPHNKQIEHLISQPIEDKNYKAALENKLQTIKNIDYKYLSQKIQETPRQIVHGDFYLDNLILTPNGEWKIIDYEQAGMFYKDYEIARALFMICYNPSESTENNLNKINSFLAGYRQTNSYADINFIIDLFLYSTANSLYCYEDWENLPESSKKFAIYKNEMLDWIKNNKNKILLREEEVLYDIGR